MIITNNSTNNRVNLYQLSWGLPVHIMDFLERN